jgi:hypothetical protein
MITLRRIEDLILPFAKMPMPVAPAKIRPRIIGQPPMSTWIYADTAECSRFLASGIAGLERNSIIVYTTLDAIVQLRDVTMTIDAVFVSLQDHNLDISKFFVFLKNHYPRFRRIAFAPHKPQHVDVASVDACLHDMIVRDPWDRAHFSEILKDALGCRVNRTRSSWTDLELFGSSQVADRQAIAEIVRRYRRRIVSLVSDVIHNILDMEDVVQEIYLNIIRYLPSFEAFCSPGHWVDRIASKSIHAYFTEDLGKQSSSIEMSLANAPITSLI